jgi:hypothetical protein
VVQIRELHAEHGQFGCDAVWSSKHLHMFEIDLLPEGYTLKEIRMTAKVFTLNVSL